MERDNIIPPDKDILHIMRTLATKASITPPNAYSLAEKLLKGQDEFVSKVAKIEADL